MKSNNGIRFYNKLSFKVGLIVILIILLGIGITLFIDIQTQNRTIVDSRIEAIKEESEILHISVKNSMLAGEAPIAVQLFKDFSRSNFISDVKLYRADGAPAFSDNITLDLVNTYLEMERFIPKTIFQVGSSEDSENFIKAVNTVNDVFITQLRGPDKMVTVYTPLINQPKCSACHGLDHVVRGVICISSPMGETIKQTQQNTLLSSGFALIGVIFLSFGITLFLNRSVISKVLQIGYVAQRVGEGDFKQKLKISSKDEIGRLAVQFNTMIEGLNERFKLSKFVSRSTLEHVKSSDEISLGGERKEVTVLFTDIRGFTSYSEKRDPEEVMATLNDIMNLQAGIIHSHGGDIDKYVGDEIMAVFTGNTMVEDACRAALEIRDILNKRQKNNESDISVGFGINTGIVVMGNMGSEERIDRTIIGDTVNLGARLCSVAGKNTIVMSDFSYRAIKEQVKVQEHKAISVKGKSKAVKIYTLRSMS